MKLENIPAIEILYMASIYRAHYIYDLAIKMLRELIEMNERSSAPNSTWVAIAQYNLAEVYSDQGNFILAKEMYKQAAESWCKVHPRSPEGMMWYSAALLGLQKQTDTLIEEAHLYRDRRDTA